MKSKMLKFKAFALSLVLVLTLFSCSDDGDDAKTFLEENGGTVWKLTLGGESIYAQINNSESSPIEFWVPSEYEDNCYENETVIGIGGVEILENTENVFKVKVEDGENDYIIMTFTITGSVLTIKYEYFEDGELDDTQTLPLQKTDDDPDDLPLCE